MGKRFELVHSRAHVEVDAVAGVGRAEPGPGGGIEVAENAGEGLGDLEGLEVDGDVGLTLAVVEGGCGTVGSWVVYALRRT